MKLLEFSFLISLEIKNLFTFHKKDKTHFLFTLLFVLINLSLSQNVRDDKKHYFCNGYLFDSDYRLSVSDIGLLCNKLSTDSRFFISIQKNIPFFTGKAEDSLYTRDSEELFFTKCRNLNSQICSYGFIISVYTEARKIRISAGNISKNIVNIQLRENIIINIKQYLQMERFYEAISRAIELLQSYSNNNYSNDIYNQNNYNNNYKPTNIKPLPQPQNQKQGNSGWGFFSILLFIICPILCICGALYYFYSQQKEEQERISIKKISYSPNQVHNYLNQLENLLNTIKYNSPPYLNIDLCLICMQKINFQYQILNYEVNSNHVEMNVMDPYQNKNNYFINNNQNNNLNFSAPLISQNTDPNNTRFACGHVYHSNCLGLHGIQYCLMCNDNYNCSLKIHNTNNTQMVDEYNIKKLMSKIDMIYGKECLQSYGEQYRDEVQKYDAAFGIGLVAVVGITGIAATAIVADSLSHQNANYFVGQQYENCYGQGYHEGMNQSNFNGVNSGNNLNNCNLISDGNYNNFIDDNNPNTAEGDY